MYHIPIESIVITSTKDLKSWALPTILSKNPQPSEIEPLGAFKIQKSPKPETSTAQVAVLDEMPVHIDGVSTQGWALRDPTPEELAADQDAILDAIKIERDRRLPLDFEFAGKMYQRDAVSIARISGAGALALGAMVQGAQPGNLRWHGRDTDFAWIASDDTLTTMDAQTCFAFGAAAAAVETEIIFAAKAFRNMDPIPDDFTDDKWWP